MAGRSEEERYCAMLIYVFYFFFLSCPQIICQVLYVHYFGFSVFANVSVTFTIYKLTNALCFVVYLVLFLELAGSEPNPISSAEMPEPEPSTTSKVTQKDNSLFYKHTTLASHCIARPASQSLHFCKLE